MTEAVFDRIAEEKLIETGDIVLAGVSGGADSVCLLLILLEYQQQLDFSLQVVHVEHGIRGTDSRRDADFVKNLCERLQIPYQVCAVDVPAYAKEQQLGLEEAARELRYESFLAASRQLLAQSTGRNIKLALAHHADDNAETMLFQLVRGSSVRGLSGIRIKRQLAEQVTLIRPLLGASRAQIEAYLSKRGEDWCVDETNTDTQYSRNRIRHEILPQLRQINSQSVLHMTQSAGQLAELSDYLEAEADRVQKKVCVWSTQACLVSKAQLEGYPAVLQREVLYGIVSRLAGSRKDIGRVHVDALKGLFALQVGRQIVLPYGLMAERVYEGIVISHREKQGKLAADKQSVCACKAGADGLREEIYDISLAELEALPYGSWYTIALPDGMVRMRVCVFAGEIRKIPKKKYTKLLNYDKIKHGLQFRRRAGGDYLTIDDAGHRKKLKSYFTEEKIPSKSRDAVWLLAEDAHILWVIGGRISAYYKIEPDTKRILEIQMSGGNYDED